MLHELPMLEAMKLWAELVEALHGVNGYGSDTAELYAYRFFRYSPLMLGGDGRKEREAEGLAAAQRLFALLELFEREHRCVVEVRGPDGWERAGLWLHGLPFDHRVHVRVRK